MTKKLILPALVLLCTALFATNGFAAAIPCSSGVNPIYVAIGSSAQFNTFAFAADAVLPSQSGYTSPTNFWASSSWSVTDSRTGLTDGGGKIWVAFDSSATCLMYTYMSFDSTVGVRSFNSWAKQTTPVANALIGAVYGATSNTFPVCTDGHASPNAGQPNCASNALITPAGSLPSAIQTFLTTQAGPTCEYSGTTCTKSTAGALPNAYCSTTDTVQTTAHYCFFNAGHADIRPDDTLYATKRAIATTFNGPAGLTSLGYGQSGCGATGTGTKVVGCAIYESFGKGGSFNVASFGLSTPTATTTDPYTAATVPPAVTINIGAAPVLVFVTDADTTSGGFGNGAPNNYAITNMNHAVLAEFENGFFGCVGDVNGSNTFPGAGNAVQVLQREPLSGTYNTFEFNAARRLSGSASTAVPEESVSSIKWLTNDDSGQELGNNPITNYNSGTCLPGGTDIPAENCGDPKYIPETQITCANGNPSRLRAIGTGEMVKATLGLESTQTSSNPQLLTPDGLGYAFWGYGNFAPAASSCETGLTGSVTCASYLGHYLTVDGIDPLFTTPGGASTLPGASSPENPNGAYHLPQCYLGGGLPTCYALPFPHILDGSYAIWTILRAQTFAAYTTGKITTPPAVLQIIAQAEAEAAGAGSDGVLLDDFIPYFKDVNNSVSPPTGSLNFGIYRTHYENGSTVAPNNGFAACAGVYTGIPINGVPGNCSVDAGGDVGGSVFTVQSDVDFNADWGSVVVGTSAAKEIYSLHQ